MHLARSFFTYNVRMSHQTDLKGMALLHTLLYVNVTRVKRANHIPFLLIGFMLLGMLDIRKLRIFNCRCGK